MAASAHKHSRSGRLVWGQFTALLVHWLISPSPETNDTSVHQERGRAERGSGKRGGEREGGERENLNRGQVRTVETPHYWPISTHTSTVCLCVCVRINLLLNVSHTPTNTHTGFVLLLVPEQVKGFSFAQKLRQVWPSVTFELYQPNPLWQQPSP